MGPKDVIRGIFQTNDYILGAFLQDLSDADLLVRPAPGANHIAWQIGHLIQSEQGLLKDIPGCKPMELPAGWATQYSKDASHKDPPTGYLTTAQSLDLYKKSRENALKNLDAFPEANLDKKTEGSMADFASTLGAMFALVANHTMMHVGQFAVVRRKLGKPIVM
jgi:hypothetical protein